jgi:excisionase family DNA binding protein
MLPQSSALLTTQQVARWLGVSSRTVCLWAECSELPALKVGRQWRFRREGIARWITQSEKTRYSNDLGRFAASAASAASSSPKKRL